MYNSPFGVPFVSYREIIQCPDWSSCELSSQDADTLYMWREKL